MRTIFLFLMLASSVHAQNTGNEPLTFYQNCFGGINNYNDSSRIDNCDFQDGRNFLTYKGYLEKRPGSYRVLDSLKTGYPIIFQNEFVSVSNVDRLIVQASTQIFSSDFGSPFVEIATVNVHGITNSVSAFGKHFFVNGYDTPWYTTGIDYITVPQIPQSCKIITFAHERLWCAEGSNLYTSAYGDYTNWEIPTLLTADAATSWKLDEQDGRGLTCIYPSPYGVIAWKRNKMFVIKGVDNDDFYKYRHSDNIGCTDNRSIQLVNGLVTWLGSDGVYQWGGGNAAPELISKEIDTTIKQIRQNEYTVALRAVTTPEEFAAGIFNKNGQTNSWSSTISPGSLTPSTWAYTTDTGDQWGTGTLFNSVSTRSEVGTLILGSATVDNFGFTLSTYQATGYPNNELVKTYSLDIAQWQGTLNNTTSWCGNVPGVYCASKIYVTNGPGFLPFDRPHAAIVFCSPSASVPTGIFSVHKVSDDTLLATQTIAREGTTWGDYVFDLSTVADTEKLYFKYTHNTQVGTFFKSTYFYAWYFPAKQLTFNVAGHRTDDGCGTGSETQTLALTVPTNITGSFAPSGTYISTIFDTQFSTPIGGPLNFTQTVPIGSTVTYSIRSATSTYNISNAAWIVASTSTSGGSKIPSGNEYWQFKIDLETSYSTQTPSIDLVTLNAASTGTWDSTVLFIGNDITAWERFIAVSNVEQPNRLTYYIRGLANTFDKDNTTIPWVVQPNGLEINYSTVAYMQVRVVSDIYSSTEPARVDSLTFNWFEGTVLQSASLYYDKNYFLSVSLSTGTSSNDTTLVWQRNNKWTIFDGLSYGTLGLYNNLPYAGSGLTDSKIWRIMYEGAYYDDNTLPINTYATTKDFQFDGQNNNKIFRNLYLESYPGNTAGVLSLAYSVDKSTTYYTTVQTLTANTMFNDEIKKFFPGYAKGRYAKFKFSNNTINEYIKMDAYTIFGEIERLYRR